MVEDANGFFYVFIPILLLGFGGGGGGALLLAKDLILEELFHLIGGGFACIYTGFYTIF